MNSKRCWFPRISPVGRCFVVACLLGALSAASAPSAYAIDPTRRLVQCLQRVWQVQNGLPQATISCILQTDDGYLWLGGPGGLIRFDGVRFTVMQNAGDVSLKQVHVQALAEDAAHNLWIGTAGSGLIRWRGEHAERITRAQGLADDTVNALLVDGQGALWVGTADGVTRRQNGQLISYPLHDLPSPAIRALAATDDGAIWIGGDSSQVSIWQNGELTKRSFASLPTDARVRALCAFDGAMWIGTDRGLLCSDSTGERRYTVADGLADDRVHCLVAGGNDSLWIGTQKGFSRIHDGQIDSFLPQDGLSQSTVYAMCEDHEGSLWVGTKHGLNQFADRRTIPFTVREGLPSDDAGPVIQDQRGDIWVGTRGAGLARYDVAKFQTFTTAQGLLSDTILSLAVGEPETVWVGTDQGINRLQHGAVTAVYTTEQGLPAPAVRCLLRDDDGELFAGTDQGLVVLRGDRFESPDSSDPRCQEPIVALGRWNGELLVSTARGGLYALRDGTLHEVAPGFRPASPVSAMLADGPRLWLALRSSGLALIENERVTQFPLSSGIYDDELFGLTSDGQGRLWMACSKGIFSVAIDELLKFAAGGQAKVQSMPFSPTDNQRTIECQSDVQPAVWTMRNGRIWFSTIHGIIVITPNDMTRALPAPQVVVESVVVNGVNHRPNDLAELPRGASKVVFRYTALSYRSATRITFQHRLVGFDPEWIDAGAQREAVYTNLPPGNYQFRLAARNVDGSVTELPAPVSFRIRPLIYQTRWFWPLCVALAAAVAWAVYRSRVRGIKGRLQAIMTERTRIARELHDTLMQGFSGVTMQLQAIASRLPGSDVRDDLNEVIGDAGNCLREARQTIAGLRNSAAGGSSLGDAIALSARQLTETSDSRLKLHLEPGRSPLPAQQEYQVLRIAQEALTNAMKHASAATIEVTLAYAPQELRLVVADDGVGGASSEQTGDARDRYGLLGMRERAAQIGGELSLDSPPGAGTRVTLCVPIARRPESAKPAQQSLEV